MSVNDTTGVSGLARVLSRLAEGTALSVADLAREEGLSRSTAFEIAKRLKTAQLVARDPTGKVTLGPRAFALGFSRFGLAALHGPAEAILSWLRDHCDATATLSCASGEARVTLASCSADWTKSAANERPATMSHPICDENGHEAARLDVVCRPNCSRSERAEIEALTLRAKATLEHYLRDEGSAHAHGEAL